MVKMSLSCKKNDVSVENKCGLVLIVEETCKAHRASIVMLCSLILALLICL